tara:strand:+ start:58 stop:558 length:501 start_codon:yes stop_codon:yes gene_type:complete
MNCSRCTTQVPKERSELGYTICTECSVEEKKVGHIIYPHKTGAYVQVVSKSTQDNLNKLDRRGYRRGGSYKHYKELTLSDNTAPKPIPRQVDSDNITLLDYTTAKDMVMNYYKEWGYTRTLQYLRQLNSDGDIALKQRCDLQDIVTELYLTPNRNDLVRKFNTSKV